MTKQEARRGREGGSGGGEVAHEQGCSKTTQQHVNGEANLPADF